MEEAFENTNIVVLDGMMVLDRDLLTKWSGDFDPMRGRVLTTGHRWVDPFIDGALGIYENLSFPTESLKNPINIKM